MKQLLLMIFFLGIAFVLGLVLKIDPAKLFNIATIIGVVFVGVVYVLVRPSKRNVLAPMPR